ncbi:hypothetical protein J5N97_014001 [Dioscorea zingiberensis]|uniref:Uncharacterized protein n=1 Tax=Dioscorea zingiberensis TaxID=325984 RepID=A0A9D5HJM4_9LILI|nr:hypothetical protein J5N97_014001 [Dioscorea zingiberensis]
MKPEKTRAKYQPPFRAVKDDTEPFLRDPISRSDPIETVQALLRLPPFNKSQFCSKQSAGGPKSKYDIYSGKSVHSCKVEILCMDILRQLLFMEHFMPSRQLTCFARVFASDMPSSQLCNLNFKTRTVELHAAPWDIYDQPWFTYQLRANCCSGCLESIFEFLAEATISY